MREPACDRGSDESVVVRSRRFSASLQEAAEAPKTIRWTTRQRDSVRCAVGAYLISYCRCACSAYSDGGIPYAWRNARPNAESLENPTAYITSFTDLSPPASNAAACSIRNRRIRATGISSSNARSFRRNWRGLICSASANASAPNVDSASRRSINASTSSRKANSRGGKASLSGLLSSAAWVSRPASATTVSPANRARSRRRASMSVRTARSTPRR